jgi:predicted nucleotidyltransferase
MVFLSTMEQRFELENDEIERIKQRLVSAIEAEGRILFAYLHGSYGIFPFRDIDIGAYCAIPKDEVFDFELEMSPKLEIISGYPVDFKVINYAPLGFQFSVINEGALLFERDRATRLNFLEEIGMRYMDYFELSKSYFKELMECTEK